MKQTAVEWLIEQIEETDSKIARVIGLKKYNEIVQQAKAIEKEQMTELVQRLKDYTAESHNILGHDEREASEFVEEYYNETYKK